MYRVLNPIYRKTGERVLVQLPSGEAERDVFAVTWKEIGKAKDMADAKRRYGGAPVLEAV